MAKAQAQAPSNPVGEAAWSPIKLFATGVLTLIVALSVIIYLGSRLGGCMYLDGSHGAGAYDKRP